MRVILRDGGWEEREMEVKRERGVDIMRERGMDIMRERRGGRDLG